MVHNAHPRNQIKSMNAFEQSHDDTYLKIDPIVLEGKILKLKLAQ